MPRSKQSESQHLELLKGHRLGPYLSHNPVSATQIWQWCSVMGDNNPLYLPGDKQLAPPAMMQMWTMRDVNDCYARGSTDAFPYRVFDDLTALGYPANVAVSYDIRFIRYLRIGEQAKHYTTVASITERKSTALGEGYFVTERVEYLTLDDAPFAEALITYFQYSPAPADVRVRAVNSPGSTHSGGSTSDNTEISKNGSSPDPRGLALNALAIGDELPELAIPITHRLIVAGAIATQDFTPVHHSVPAAQAAGMPDIFMNILTTCGLSVRYLTDWTGSDGRVKQVKFKLMAPNLPGDLMLMKGAVIAVDPAAAEMLVEIAFTGENRLGIHISGTATVALPNSNG